MTGPPGLDLERLAGFLAPLGILGAPLSGEVIEGGRSNLTYVVSDGKDCVVVRRPPLGHVLATAHDMGREYRVMTALAPTAVPVPATIALCQDVSVIGAPFYVMQRVDGTVFRTPEQTATLGPERATALSYALIDVLADLHDVDPAEVGLSDFGRPDGYLERQLRRWRTQLDASHSREVPGIDELHARLAATRPDSGRAALVHGDFRLDNLIVDDDDRIAAVLDWEMATLGDPLADLGLLLVYWDRVTGDPDDTGRPWVSDAVNARAGFPPGRDVVARYARRRGVDLSRLPWYVGFGYFKLAVIAEGIYYRYVHGQTVGAGFEHFGAQVPVLVARGAKALTEA
jgi:aminoglycoside phosphotransferase (APT) family kinase protein